MGPEALRVAGLGEALRSRGLDVIDRGNLTGPANPWQPPTEGYRHLAQVADWNRLIYEAIRAELGHKRLPILLGGDHCLAIGSISAVARHCRDTQQEAARALARCARGFQYVATLAERQHSRHAGRVPVRLRPARADGPERHQSRALAEVDSPDRHPQRRPGREALRARAGAGSVRHALHRRDGACGTRCSRRWPDWMPTRICT